MKEAEGKKIGFFVSCHPSLVIIVCSLATMLRQVYGEVEGHPA